MNLDSLYDLFVDELKDLYNAEGQILKALPKMIRAADSPQLKSTFQEHLEQTRDQVDRLEQIFNQLGYPIRGKKCKGMEGIIDEGKEIMDTSADPAVKDAGLIAAAQRVEHYEIAGYGTVRSYAQMLGNQKAAQLLQQTLDEEGQTDKKLTELAENTINVEAAQD